MEQARFKDFLFESTSDYLLMRAVFNRKTPRRTVSAKHCIPEYCGFYACRSSLLGINGMHTFLLVNRTLLYPT